MAEGDSRSAMRDGRGNTIPVNDNNPGIVVEGNDRGDFVCTLTSAATPTRRAAVFSQESQKHNNHHYQYTQ